MAKIQRSVLAQALYQQISAQELYERKVLGYSGDSAGLVTLRDVLVGLQRGEGVEVLGDID